MIRHAQLLIGVGLVSGVILQARDANKTFELLKKGKELSAAEARKLEEKVERSARDEEARIELLSYYTTAPAGAELATIRAARARHILWLIKNDPKNGLGLFQVATGVYRVNCKGDDLADADGAERVGDAWLEEVKKAPDAVEVRRSAVEALQICSPDKAEQILSDSNDRAGLGRLYANAVLGVTGLSYSNSDPSGSDSALRNGPFAARARSALEQGTDKEFLVSAAVTTLRDGAILWADGKLDWDYTALGKTLLAKAKQAAPDEIRLVTLPTELPTRGERPPMTIRVGGNVQQALMVHSVAPHYPAAARSLGIEGTVQLMAVIGLDGKVLFLRPDAGPPELIPSAVEAVRQWQYKTTTLNGKPCYVTTRIDVNFRLR